MYTFNNLTQITLVSDLTDTETTTPINEALGDGFIVDLVNPQYATLLSADKLDYEIVRIVDSAGDNTIVTFLRAQHATTAKAFLAGSTLYAGIDATQLNYIMAQLATPSTGGGSVKDTLRLYQQHGNWDIRTKEHLTATSAALTRTVTIDLSSAVPITESIQATGTLFLPQKQGVPPFGTNGPTSINFAAGNNIDGIYLTDSVGNIAASNGAAVTVSAEAEIFDIEVTINSATAHSNSSSKVCYIRIIGKTGDATLIVPE